MNYSIEQMVRIAAAIQESSRQGKAVRLETR
jgi:hypothetical protein